MHAYQGRQKCRDQHGAFKRKPLPQGTLTTDDDDNDAARPRGNPDRQLHFPNTSDEQGSTPRSYQPDMSTLRSPRAIQPIEYLDISDTESNLPSPQVQRECITPPNYEDIDTQWTPPPVLIIDASRSSPSGTEQMVQVSMTSSPAQVVRHIRIEDTEYQQPLYFDSPNKQLVLRLPAEKEDLQAEIATRIAFAEDLSAFVRPAPRTSNAEEESDQEYNVYRPKQPLIIHNPEKPKKAYFVASRYMQMSNSTSGKGSAAAPQTSKGASNVPDQMKSQVGPKKKKAVDDGRDRVRDRSIPRKPAPSDQPDTKTSSFKLKGMTSTTNNGGRQMGATHPRSSTPEHFNINTLKTYKNVDVSPVQPSSQVAAGAAARGVVGGMARVAVDGSARGAVGGMARDAVDGSARGAVGDTVSLQDYAEESQSASELIDELAYAEYAQWIYLHTCACKNYKEQEAVILKQHFELWCINRELKRKKHLLEMKLLRAQFNKQIDNAIQAQTDSLQRVINQKMYMQEYFGLLGQSVHTTCHQMICKGVYLPEDLLAFTTRMVDELKETYGLLKELNYVCNVRKAGLIIYKDELNHLRQVIEREVDELTRCGRLTKSLEELATEDLAINIETTALQNLLNSMNVSRN